MRYPRYPRTPTESAEMQDTVRLIAARLTALRAERELTLQEVADRAGLSKSHVWELEQGRARNPTLDTVLKLSTALGVSLDFLTGIASADVALHPEAMRIACEVDALLRNRNGSTP